MDSTSRDSMGINESGLSLKGVTKVFDDFTAVNEVTFTVSEGEFICIVGPSGCGKTTVLRLVAGLVAPTIGSLSMDGIPISGPGSDRGMIFQDYALFPWRTVQGNVAFGLEMKDLAKQAREERVNHYINLVGLSDFAARYPRELSGGMKQRVAIARVFANEPKVILADEPFGALDAQTRRQMQEEILSIWKAERKTILFVTHSVEEAIFLADRIVLLSAKTRSVKRIISVGLPRPRERLDAEFSALHEDVLAQIHEEAVFGL
ncbi:MAG: ABC transporter ATP-binding protein [Halobacteriota archaeon]